MGLKKVSFTKKSIAQKLIFKSLYPYLQIPDMTTQSQNTYSRGFVSSESFDINKLRFVPQKISAKDKESNRTIEIPQLHFDYTSESVVEGGSNIKPKFIIQSPRLTTRQPVSMREGKNGEMEYSLFQKFNMMNPEENHWVENNRSIRQAIATEVMKPDVKKFIGHKFTKNDIVGNVRSLIYQEVDEEGEYVKDSSPSCFFNLFHKTLPDGKSFGTDFILSNGTVIPRNSWIKILSTSMITYTVNLRYLRVTYAGQKFAVITQAHSVIIHDIHPIARESPAALIAKGMKISDEEKKRANEIEKMLSMDNVEDIDRNSVKKHSISNNDTSRLTTAEAAASLDLGLDVDNVDW